MVCRNPKYAEEAQKEIQDVSKSDKIHVHILDMSDPKADRDVKRAFNLALAFFGKYL